MSDLERDVRNHWMMFGVAACVTKIDRKWMVWNGAPGFPLFKTKREAMAAVDSWVLAISRKRAFIN